MAADTFWPTRLTKQSQPIANLFNIYDFHTIWKKFGMWTDIGQKITWNEIEMATAIFWPTITNIIILWVLSLSEPIELFWIILLTSQCHFELLALFHCSCPLQTCRNRHHHHPTSGIFFQSRAAFCGSARIYLWRNCQIDEIWRIKSSIIFSTIFDFSFASSVQCTLSTGALVTSFFFN